MVQKITLVTPPDDISVNGVRILTVNLTIDQNQTISTCLSAIDSNKSVIIYSWKDTDDFDWLINKCRLSNLIIFNAYQNQLLNGYLSSYVNSWYFGDIQHLQKVNNNVLYDSDIVQVTLDNYIG